MVAMTRPIVIRDAKLRHVLLQVHKLMQDRNRKGKRRKGRVDRSNSGDNLAGKNMKRKKRMGIGEAEEVGGGRGKKDDR
jgi:hypothetical protein